MPNNLFLVDSTTVTLFSSVLKGVGRNPINGKKKGGLKIHTVINACEDVPCLVKLSQASSHDSNYLNPNYAVEGEELKSCYLFLLSKKYAFS